MRSCSIDGLPPDTKTYFILLVGEAFALAVEREGSVPSWGERRGFSGAEQ